MPHGSDSASIMHGIDDWIEELPEPLIDEDFLFDFGNFVWIVSELYCDPGDLPQPALHDFAYCLLQSSLLPGGRGWEPE
jgi:hypothetical protein